MNTLNNAKSNLKKLISEIENLENYIDDNFLETVDELYKCTGRIIFTGIGKTGIIAKKLSATFSSTGSNSLFMHTSEALHGDLGMVSNNDIIVAVSNSGSSKELLSILPSIRHIGSKIIALTGNINSDLAVQSDIVINTHINNELCPLNLAPTTSTTAALIIGDLLAIEVMRLKNFKVEDFALYHPGGAIGRKLLQKAKDIMITDIPKINIDGDFNSLLYEISSKRIGAVCVLENDKICGLITDGDIRRKIEIIKENIFKVKLKDLMSSNFIKTSSNELAVEILKKMKRSKISVIPVIDDDKLVGIINIHDLHDFG